MKILIIRRCAKITRHLLTILGLLLSGLTAAAPPDLQLGIGNGYYDVASQTVITASRHFILNAYADAATGMDETYSVAISIVYDPGLDPADFGTFHFNGQTITAAAMGFGKPPPGNDSAVIDDRGLARLGITEAWYIRHGFGFDEDRRTLPVNTRDNPQHMPVAMAHKGDESYLYYQSFGVSTLALKDGYNLHFALYSGGEENTAGDSAISRFAPFSHDAATAYVAPVILPPIGSALPSASIPEPGIIFLFVLALAGIGYSQKHAILNGFMAGRGFCRKPRR